MAQVQVWNDNKYIHKEMFKGQEIIIGAGEFIVMDEDEANMFKGQYMQMKMGNDDRQDPRSFKKIRIGDKVDDDKALEIKKEMALELTCQRCGYVALTKKMLDEHINDNHLQDMEDQEFAEKRKRGRPKKEAVIDVTSQS